MARPSTFFMLPLLAPDCRSRRTIYVSCASPCPDLRSTRRSSAKLCSCFLGVLESCTGERQLSRARGGAFPIWECDVERLSLDGFVVLTIRLRQSSASETFLIRRTNSREEF